jgi:hypothetical protein
MGVKDRIEGYVNSRRKSISVEEALAHPRKRTKERRFVKGGSAVLVLTLSLLLLVVAGVYTGYITYHEGKAGYIYEMNIFMALKEYNWAGVYGASFGVGESQEWKFNVTPGSMTEANVFFDCFQRGIAHEIYASTLPQESVDMTELVPATLMDIDNYIGITNSAFDSAQYTFTDTISISIGARTVNNIPATHTQTGTGTNASAFSVGAMKTANGTLVFVAPVYGTLVRGFNDRYYNFQLLLPIPFNQSRNYYLWSDPNDICLGGDGEPKVTGFVGGNVTDASGNLLEDVLVIIESVSTVTPANGSYLLAPEVGQKMIVAIKTGYKVYQNYVNVTENNLTIHNIIMQPETPPNENTDIGPDFNPQTDVGPGQSNGIGPGEVPPQVQSPKVIEGQDYIIAISSINKKIREGEFVQDVLVIQSIRATNMNLEFTILGDIANLTQLDKTKLNIGPKSQGTITMTFFGNQPPGTYNGTLNISGGVNVEIPMTVEIIDKDKIPIQALLMSLSIPARKLYSGSTLTFRNDLTNLLSDQEYPVNLIYTVQSLDGTNTIWTYNSNVFIKTSLSILKNVELPGDLKEGDYIIRVTADYLDLTASSSYVFTVNLPFYQYMLFGKLRVWHAALILLGIISIVASVILIRKRIESKKRYHLKVEMGEIPKNGPRSIWLGKLAETDHRAYMILENFKTHTIVAGSTGGGKSFSAQVIIEEMLLKDVAIIVFDPTAQWTGMLRKLTNKGLMGLYPNFGMKPTDARAFTGNIRQITNSRELIDIRKYMKPGEIQIFACHKLDPKEIDMFVANTVREVFHANFDESEPLRLVLVYDEVHRLLPKFGGSGEGFLQIERACREFRKWGIGVVLISQVLADFVGQIKANINTEVQMRTRDEGDLDRIKTKYGGDILQSLVKASVGTGMVQNSAYNRGKPYFITFRPIMHSVARLSDEEIAQYNKFNEQISQLAYELEQLEEQKQDVFDLKMELKLALDKVKAGNFNMVQIYLEGLEPRVKKLWEKLGITPKKLEVKMVSEDAMKAELDKAKADRAKFEAENKKTEGGEAAKEETPAERFKKDVPPDKILHLHNDMLVVNPKSLYSEIEAMKDADFAFHVTETKNDFADWIRKAINDDELADNLATARTKADVMKFLDMREKGQKLPVVKKEAKPQAAADTTNTVPAAQAATAAPAPAAAPAAETAVKQETKQETKPEEKKGDAQTEKKDEPKIEQKTEQKTETKNDDRKNEKKEKTPEELKKEEEAKLDAFKNFSKSPEEIKQELLEKKAPDGKTFRLEDGEELKSLQDLLNSIEKMPDNIFANHVTKERNDFADWTKNVFEIGDTADKIRNAKTKNELKEVLMKIG